MAAGERAPGWESPPQPFRARSGDTLPGLPVPGLPVPGLPVPAAYPAALPAAYRAGYSGPGPDDIVPGLTEPSRRSLPRRLARRAAATLGVLIALSVTGASSLLILTPSASRAQAIAEAQDRVHGIAYPGPPVPPRFAAALVATEDHRFYQDPGIDPLAVGRVILGYLTGNGAQQGGSTITQQLAKMLYTPGRSGLQSEAEQVALAVKLNFSYSKAQVLQMYADVAYFGQGYYSLGAASCGYFGVSPAHLTWPQAALLAGLMQAPSAYDPRVYPALARAREAHVLSRLAAAGVLTQAQAAAAVRQPIGLVPASLARTAPRSSALACGR